MFEQTLAARFIKTVNAANTKLAQWICYLTLVITATVCYEVLCRYFLNSPTDWANELNQYLLCGLSMLGGGYCLLQDQHVRVDVLYMHFGLRRRAIVELCTWWLVVLFCLVMIIWGGGMAWEAFVKNKRSMSMLEWPLYPSLAMVPLGGLLVLMQALAKILGNVLIIKAGKARQQEVAEMLGAGKSIFE